MTISLDDAFDCYEMCKRNVTNVPLFYYDFLENDFVKIKGSIRNSGVIFINCYKLCLKLIDEYLNQPSMKEYKIAFEKKYNGIKNKVVEFLWFFEHIDGCNGFKKYEILRVTEELKKWCDSNNLGYWEPEVYCIS